ncbi:tRNA (adenosine(37)-N6)-threonylcarbamoyltransferase complex dimerization subunit type 1 TsaB [Candidatus Agathobaculum pullicola]|uniref:tRNA (adenosine(37)-N6)-threonylcarbamoyltransferase complex dimerization subunit type 1 TsaB n=1 Tax=Candidatus Agathobaculum pullicola TaxID=2838426 RepID=UPI003F925779
MKILALESSAVSASVALTEDEKLIAQSFQNCGLTHSRTLLPMVEGLLQNCGLTLDEVDAIAVAHGPGSFTGVRIGVATVKGLALGADKPCIGVSTLEAMAYGAHALDGRLCCVMDARAGQVYNALFSIENGLPSRLCEDRAVKLTDLAEEIGDTAYFLVGDGAELCYNTLREKCTGLRLAPPELRYPTGYGVAAVALPLLQAGKTCSPQELDAFYLRRPQAERERMKRLSGNAPNLH